jgi:DUF917 family protein
VAMTPAKAVNISRFFESGFEMGLFIIDRCENYLGSNVLILFGLPNQILTTDYVIFVSGLPSFGGIGNLYHRI